MDVIRICDLEVFYRVGVPAEERAKPQALMFDIQMEIDFTEAAERDDLRKTIDYFEVSQRLLRFGDNREWKLIETLAREIAAMILNEFGAEAVRVEVKKFIIRDAKYVSVATSLRR